MAKKGVEELGVDAIRRMGSESEGFLRFDLSRLTGDEYASLLKSLPKAISHGVNRIGFNTNLLAETTELRALDAQKPARSRTMRQNYRGPTELSNSAVQTRPGLVDDLARRVAGMLRQPLGIEGLEFCCMAFSTEAHRTLIDAYGSCTTLRVLRYFNVPFTEEDATQLCRVLTRPSVVDLQLRRCGLTDSFAEPLAAMLQMHPFIQKFHELQTYDETPQIIRIQRLDLQENEFGIDFLDQLEAPLMDLDLERVDLRGNCGIPAGKLSELQEQLPPGSLLHGPSVPVCLNQEKEALRKKKHRQAVLRKIAQLEGQNRELREFIHAFEDLEVIAELEPQLYIVGEDAPKFVDEFVRIDSTIARKKLKIKPFLRAR